VSLTGLNENFLPADFIIIIKGNKLHRLIEALTMTWRQHCDVAFFILKRCLCSYWWDISGDWVWLQIVVTFISNYNYNGDFAAAFCGTL